jgi:hypothetical protein
MYSVLSLTKMEDHVAALSGIAIEVREAMKLHDRLEKTFRPLNYVVGLWDRDVHHGLMWELQDTSSQHKIVESFPTWSWASIQGQVRWPERESSACPAATVLQLKAMKPQAEIAHVSATTSCSKQYIRYSDAFDVTNSFTNIIMRTKTSEVMVGRKLGRESADIAMRATFESSHDVSDENWREISTPSFPDILAGWGKFERPEKLENNTIYAVLISTISVPGGLSFGYFSLWHPVYCVLYCIMTSDGGYQRVGVGRLFAKEVIHDFSYYIEDIIRLC